MIKRLILVSVCMLILAACGDNDDDSPQLVAPEQRTSAPTDIPADTVLTTNSSPLTITEQTRLGNGAIWDLVWPNSGLVMSGPVGAWRYTGDQPESIDGWRGYVVIGKTYAITSQEGSLQIWDSATGARLFDLPFGEQWRGYATFNADESRFALVAYDAPLSDMEALPPGQIQVWDTTTGTMLTSYDLPEPRFLGLTFLPDGTLIAAGSVDNRLEWSQPGGEPPQPHSHDFTIKVWNLDSGERISTLTGLEGPADGVVFSPDGSRIAASGSEFYAYGPSVQVWDTATGEPIYTLDSRSDGPSAPFVFSPDGRTFATSHTQRSDDMTEVIEEIWLWDLDSGEHSATLSDPDHLTSLWGHQITDLMFNADGSQFAILTLKWRCDDLGCATRRDHRPDQ